MKKNCGPQTELEIRVCHFLRITPLVFLDISQDCGLGQYLTSSTAETSKNKIKNK